MTLANEPGSEIYQLALHSAPSGIMVVAVNGNIQYANQSLADMFGHDVEALVGQSVEVLLPEKYAAAHRRHVENYAQRPEPRAMNSGRDLEGISKDKRRFPVEIGLHPAQTNAGPVVIATVIDITKRKAIEERLRRHEEELAELVAERTRELHKAQRDKERMLDQLIQAEKMTAVGTLASGIGHEINNPLYVILAAAEAISDAKDMTGCRAHSQEILKQAINIAEIVKNLSRYAQPGTRHDLELVDLNESVDGAVHLAQRTFQGDQIEFKITTSPAPEILAKSEEIQQVLFNIVRNAIQAINGNGRIEIRTVSLEGWVSVSIEDNGVGIPNENLKQLFDPFFTTKGPDEGEGLGLYIVRQLVTRYRGTIDVENAADGGSRFELRFPVANQKNSKRSTNETSCSGTG
jgi:two-component system NtrC family sensor kinase